MTLIICSLASLPEVLAQRQPSHLITLLGPDWMIDEVGEVGRGRHLRITVDDIHEPMPGLIAPEAADVERALAFARAWDGDAPMVVHCFAGVSRSSATALAIACERNPDTPEQEIALLLRRLAPHAFPNRRITAIADQLLGRRGRLIHAVEAMGRDDLEAPHVPVELPSRFPTIVVPP
jgi:predicted protein tyrosine phosphatase